MVKTSSLIAWRSLLAAVGLVVTASCWRPDNTICGTNHIANYYARSSNPRLFDVRGQSAHFFASPPDGGLVLYEYDGAELRALDSLSEEPVTWGTFQGSAVLLTTSALWRLNEAGHLEVMKRLPEAVLASAIEGPFLVEFRNRLYFASTAPGSMYHLTAYDPATDAVELPELADGGLGAQPFSRPAVVNDTLVFSAGTGVPPTEGSNVTSWWSYDGRNLTELAPGPLPSLPLERVVHQGELWLYSNPSLDGRIHGTLLRYRGGVDPPTRPSALDLMPVASVGGTLFLIERSPQRLWTYDASGFSIAVADLSRCLMPGGFAVAEGKLYFTCSPPGGGYPLDLLAYDIAARRLDTLVEGRLDGTGYIYSYQLEPAVTPQFILAAGIDTGAGAFSRNMDEYVGTGTEPWAYSLVNHQAKLVSDLAPGYTVICHDPD